MLIIPYNRKFKDRSRELRKQGILGEVILRKHLRVKQIFGYQFFRQKPIDNYIVDFFCTKLNLAIEVDGSSHDKKVEDDRYRQERLEILGVTFLRFTESEVRTNIDSVLLEIERKVLDLQQQFLP